MFHLPPGFEIQLVAAEPMIAKPMNIAFDDRSRLWVTDSLEYPFPAKADSVPQLGGPHHGHESTCRSHRPGGN